MAGWSKVTTTDGSALDCFRIIEEIFRNGVSLKCEEEDIDGKLTKLFNQIVSKFLKEICDTSCFRPLPPMLGDGKPIDLLRLYLSVREKGGYENVSRNGYWDLVAEDIGCDSNASASLKVVYVKYLDLLDEWFAKNVEDNNKNINNNKNSRNGSSSFNDLMVDSRFSDVEMKDYKEFVGLDDKDLQSCVDGDNNKKSDDSSGRDSVVIESVLGVNEEENESSRKRKRERYLPLLDWVKRVSKDPCDPAIGSMPERSKWKVYGGEHVWKQVLSAREAMLLRSNVDSKKVIIWQKNLRMVPAMYDDQREKSTSRCSQRLISARETQSTTVSSRKPQPQEFSESSSNSPSDREDEDYFWGCNFKRKRTPLGRCFQAKVPEWTEQTYEPDTKWLGTPVWPLEKTETRNSLIELDRIGKGRQEDSCGCQFSGSLECVRFHVSEKRNRARLELGSAFEKWKFDDMGENVALKWARSDEKKFEDIIKSTPASSGTSFWDEISSHFKNKKTMAVMVSYYFNVYLLRRRAHQNRSDPNNIDSDDDELEKVGNEASNNIDSGSILCSPKKVRNGR